MSDLVPSSFEGWQVRTVLIDGEVWFVLADVAKILGYRDANHAGRILRDRDRRTHRMGTPNGVTVTIISEAGLYRLIMRSNQPKAEDFQDWVTDDLLPTLRKERTYSLEPQPKAPAELSPREMALLILQEADRADAAEARVAEQGKELDTARPKAILVDTFYAAREDTTTIGDLAKQLGLREQVLRDYLVKRKRIYRKVFSRRYSSSKGRWVIDYEWRPCSGYESWFVLLDHPEVERLYNNQIPKTMYANPVGKARIAEMLRDKPVETVLPTDNITKLPARRGRKKPGGAA